MVAVDTRNRPPAFADQDTETDGVQNTATTRKVEENAEAVDDADPDVATDNVGGVVMATDPDPNADPLTYTLEGTDASKFRVRDTGQIEVASGTELDFETKQTYMVTVMAEDSFGDSASIMVTITVTDVNEGPDITGEDTIEHPENRTSSVETYRASDPEGAGTITWSLAGTDAALFDLSSNGVLTFKEQPNYEMPGDDDVDNMYEVTVQATDADHRVGTKPVTVEVTNVDEPGVVTLSARQPMAGVPLTATITDPDGDPSNIEWQWQEGSSNIPNADGETYTPADLDKGSYLRATATYKDPESGRDSKRANVRSDYVVLRAATGNNAPEFADDQDLVMEGEQVDAARKVSENTEAGENIGAPVRATDADSGQKLTYTLDDNSAMSFDIDWATGQLKTKAALNFETAPVLGDGNGFTVTVRATDPAGIPQADTADTDNSDTVTVNIMVTDVNEPPAIDGDAAVTFAEVAENIAAPLDAYGADDPETVGAVDTTTVTWSVAGADGSKFEIDDGALTFKDKPDYEMPTDTNKDNVYEVTVRAADADRYIGTLAVKVSVINENEDGTVTLSKTRPRVGIAVTASVTDPDGSISGLTWQWYDDTIIENDLTTNAIEGANSDTYTPVAEDVGATLSARASYTDGQSAPDATSKKTAMGTAADMVAVDTRNRAPVFEDQDTETDGVQNTETTRKVEEIAEAVDDSTDDSADDNVGSPVTANDPDPNADALTYTLGGADADSFTVRADGQIEVGDGTKLDYETKTTYMVTVMAEDSFGDSATIMVTIMVTDVDEAPEIMLGGLAIGGSNNIEYAEKGMVAVATYTATGPDADRASWSLEGDDAGIFRIGRNDGTLSFRNPPDYENPMDMGMDNMYMVTIMADDGTYMDTHDVMVMVTNVDEMGRVTFWRDGADATTAAMMVGDMLGGLAEDPDGNVGDTPPITDMYPNITGATWQWAKTMTPDMMASWMDITGATDAAYMVMDADEGYHLRATAMYDDGEGMGKMASEETMMVMMMMTMNAAPMFATETAERMAPENTAAGENVGAPLTAMDADNDTLIYSLGGTDAASFDIGSATGQLMTEEALDYETKSSYEVMVTATDPNSASDMITVTVTVTNVEEPGMVTLWASATDALTMAPQVGDTITGAVMDPDGNPGEMPPIAMDTTITDVTWQWYRTTTPAMMDSWEEIAGETNAAYMVTADDTDDYLRVMATYTDAVGTDTDMEYSPATMMVGAEAGDTLLDRYDANDDESIDRDEMVDALRDYLFNDAITRDDMVTLLRLYLFG